MPQDTTPRQRVDSAVHRWGSPELVRRSCAVLAGAIDPELTMALGGATAPAVIDGNEGGLEGRWPRVWAARALLYAWEPDAESPLLRAHTDPEWRVREMVAKVIAARQLSSPDAEAAALTLSTDHNARVRAAAERALT